MQALEDKTGNTVLEILKSKFMSHVTQCKMCSHLMIPHSLSTATMQKVSYHHQKICFHQEHPTVTAAFMVESAYLVQLHKIILHV